ncbi:hypothetical protein [Planomonospora parontospora]|uniref:hypothetical protein n=1 Tax=Planomonospora parontospora TaxID=58119 RepID=UPI00166FD4A3|nr:hypothetical protein [Planomonospora parontospora]GGL54235.1 hypothetical protein GCM10014719_64470 [Planomonospora parontospora subsp. antibiotica]GII19717.1 hypothetical protein Ppa05_64430 [Planomonospora parontospora subsp. antibiotica]
MSDHDVFLADRPARSTLNRIAARDRFAELEPEPALTCGSGRRPVPVTPMERRWNAEDPVGVVIVVRRPHE